MTTTSEPRTNQIAITASLGPYATLESVSSLQASARRLVLRSVYYELEKYSAQVARDFAVDPTLVRLAIQSQGTYWLKLVRSTTYNPWSETLHIGWALAPSVAAVVMTGIRNLPTILDAVARASSFDLEIKHRRADYRAKLAQLESDYSRRLLEDAQQLASAQSLIDEMEETPPGVASRTSVQEPPGDDR